MVKEILAGEASSTRSFVLLTRQTTETSKTVLGYLTEPVVA